MSEIKNSEQLEGVGAAYTMLKQLFESLIANAERRRLDAAARKSVRGIAFCDSSLQFFRRCAEMVDEDFVEFTPFEPLPVDENGEPYFPPNKGILLANLTITEGRLRPDFFDEEKKNDDVADN